MKTNNSAIAKLILSAGLVAAVSFMSGCATSGSTANQMKPMKGGEHMLMGNRIETTQDLAALKTDDSMAMVCTKCKTVYVSRVKQGMKGAQVQIAGGTPTEMIGTHGCAGCSGTWTITGVGKGATTELKHSCSMCGDASGFCCATKAGSGPTKGM